VLGVEQLTVEVVSRVPHDPGSYTQGLVLDDGTLYESAGNYGQSEVRKVDPVSGAVLARSDNDPSEFGEGLALVDGRLIQLTWQAGTAHILDAATLARVGTYSYEGEGWGLCHDGQRLVMSNGRPDLTFRDPDTFAAVGSVTVTLEGQPVEGLNELECVDGSVYANVYLTDTIVRIDPASGRVSAVVDASALRASLDGLAGDEVLNGIAHVEGGDRFLLTGKHWPTMFEVRFVPQRG
jgi:glutamine cyclotransferase